jgi:hypothetical protein
VVKSMTQRFNALDRSIIGLSMLVILYVGLTGFWFVTRSHPWSFQLFSLMSAPPWLFILWVSSIGLLIPLSVVALMRRDRTGLFGLGMIVLLILWGGLLQFLLGPVAG